MFTVYLKKKWKNIVDNYENLHENWNILIFFSKKIHEIITKYT